MCFPEVFPSDPSPRGVLSARSQCPQKWKNGFFFVLFSWPRGFPNQWIEETPPPLSVGERDASLTSFINILNEHSYDCQAQIDKRLLGHFGLSPHVEPLDQPLGIIILPILRFFAFLMSNSDLLFVCFSTYIMFSKYFQELSDKERERRGNTPASRSARGTPASSTSKGKRPMSPSEGPAKRTRGGSTGTPPAFSSKPSMPSPHPPIKEEKGVPPRSPRSSGGLFSRSSFTLEEAEASSLAASLIYGGSDP
ncbi:UNVERIFIED_CONTAM: hypothetical protein Sradi_5711700 [Sesamum radiatum]|uniref:Uncharacterized protein n=1 Tax=Sesamum radiatum TaxID=300843 RepID=A0AAW2L158_SESRA